MHRYLFLLLATLLATLSATMTTAHAAHETCIDCHVDAAPQPTTAALRVALPGLCLQCHADRVAPGEHRIDVTPTTPVPASLPLVNGQVSCTTCHDAHLSTPTKTRMVAPQLCIACHAQ